jgi:hypothetical protein
MNPLAGRVKGLKPSISPLDAGDSAHLAGDMGDIPSVGLPVHSPDMLKHRGRIVPASRGTSIYKETPFSQSVSTVTGEKGGLKDKKTP